MSQFLASHPMENFFINPTMTQDNSMESFARISTMTEAPKIRFDGGLPIDDTSDVVTTNSKTVRSVATIQDLFAAHNFGTGYHSEEEAASPRDSSDDNLSLHSGDAELNLASSSPLSELDLFLDAAAETPSAEHGTSTTIDQFLVPEELASSCVKIEHRCNRAQAVVIKPVGKPKMVSMPRLVDVPAKPLHLKRPSDESFASSTRAASMRRAENRRAARLATLPKPSHDMTALPVVLSAPPVSRPVHGLGRQSPPDPETSTIVDAPRQAPTVSHVRNISAFDAFPRLADIAAGNLDAPSIAIKRSMTVSAPVKRVNTDDTNAPPMTPTRRRLHRLASTISNASDLVRRKSSISSMRKQPATPSSSVAPSPNLSLASNAHPQSSAFIDTATTTTAKSSPSIPRRSSSMGKLTPRGASERAPILVLPPFPNENDEEDDDDFGDASNERGLQKWDRPRARQAAKLTKTRPTIDGVVHASRA